MQIFQLTPHIKLLFQSSDAPDILEGDSDKEPNFYDKFYERGENPLKGLRIYQYKQLLQECSIVAPFKKHLDIGCGDGLFVDLSREILGSDSVGIDSHAPEGKPFVRRMSLDEFVKQEIGQTKFDAISLLDVLEHFRNPTHALQALKDLMKDSGTLIVKVPSKNSMVYRLTKQIARIVPSLARGIFMRMYQVNYPPPHYYYYNLPSLTKLLNANGFDVIRHGFITETPVKGLKKRLWNLKPRLRPIAFTILLSLQIFTPVSMYDGLYVIARKRLKN